MEKNNLTGMQAFAILAGACSIFFLVLYIFLQPTKETPESVYDDYLNEQRGEADTVRQDIDELCASCYDDYYCANMGTCQQAMYCLNSCGLTRLDGDGDGIPCETICE